MTPGSPEALANGCCCPAMDNAGGDGIPGTSGKAFWINETCPLHGINAPRTDLCDWPDESGNTKDMPSKP